MAQTIASGQVGLYPPHRLDGPIAQLRQNFGAWLFLDARRDGEGKPRPEFVGARKHVEAIEVIGRKERPLAA